MAAQTSFTQDNITALEQAIATGALEVWYGDKRVKYRTLDEMKEILAIMKEALDQTLKPKRRHYADYNSGL